MKKVSTKRAALQRKIRAIVKLLPEYCVICGAKATDPAHLLPKGLFPEYAAHEDNIVPLCRDCHRLHDDNIEFRTNQTKLFKQACKVDLQAAKRYYKRNG